MKKKIMCIGLGLWVMALPLRPAQASIEGDGVAITRVTANTRQSLGALAASDEARELSEKLKTLDTQYEAWSKECGGQQFSPKDASPTCRSKMHQMAEVQVQIYQLGAHYLRSVAKPYGRGKREAGAIAANMYHGESMKELHDMTLQGVSGGSDYATVNTEVTSSLDDSPFPIVLDGFNDPGAALMTSLEQLVPDIPADIPEVVRAGVLAAELSSKEKAALKLAKAYDKAANILSSKQDYETISVNITKSITQVPRLLGITGVNGGGFSAKADKYVLAWRQKTLQQRKARKQVGGLAPIK
ncbi:MAG TPA: hypothetical protein ENJ30_02790 [Desulfobulbaceae bacterium]|nr:hypothetical protein [Desulfobulbaceae bacterium]